MSFEALYVPWYQRHWEHSGRERRRRLEKHSAEDIAFLGGVWFPLMGALEGLTPQAEIVDVEGRVRYLDYAWMQGGLLLNIEIDAAFPLDRRSAVEEKRRDVALQIGGWQIARFAQEDVLHRPEHCRQALGAWMGRWVQVGKARTRTDPRQEEVLRLAMAGGGTVRFREVVRCLQVSDKTALAVLRGLVDQGLIAAAGGAKKRVHKYYVRSSALKKYYLGQTYPS